MYTNANSRNRLSPLHVALIAGALALAGCATTQPVVMNAGNSKPTASRQAEQAITACREAADRDVGRNGLQPSKVGKKVGKTAAVEFTDAAADTAIRKGNDVLRRATGAAAGGVAGVATKLLFEWNEPDKVHQKYVELCLEKRGHRVLGWR
jgi:hypothetical protein